MSELQFTDCGHLHQLTSMIEADCPYCQIKELTTRECRYTETNINLEQRVLKQAKQIEAAQAVIDSYDLFNGKCIVEAGVMLNLYEALLPQQESKQTRTKIPEDVTTVRNVVTGKTTPTRGDKDD